MGEWCESSGRGIGACKDPGEKGQIADITKQNKENNNNNNKKQAFIRRRERGKWKTIAQYSCMCTVENFRELINADFSS